jgi:hypothetical protein
LYLLARMVRTDSVTGLLGLELATKPLRISSCATPVSNYNAS